MYIVEGPTDCRECGSIYCDKCVVNSHNSEGKCPQCRTIDAFDINRKFSRYMKNQLNDLTFNCLKCSSEFTYAGYSEHYKTC